MKEEYNIIPDEWNALRSFTTARIALGRTGVSLPLNEVMRFKMAHAHARDAVFSKLVLDDLQMSLSTLSLTSVALQSKAVDRQVYLQRPDFGRQLNESSQQSLSSLASGAYEVCICLADGLSAEAINHHAIPVVERLYKELSKQNTRMTPVCIIEGGRVAIGDEIGSLLHASVLLMLIGERPGLSSPNSMSAYLTYAPQPGLTDERRNCVSNIRQEGLRYDEAVIKIMYLIHEMRKLKLSGIALKDNTGKGLPLSSF